MAPDQSDIAARLQRFISQAGGSGVVQGTVEPIPEGHAGLAYRFALALPDGGRSHFILKLAPLGVRRSGSTDIYRQAPLLRLLGATDLPVPAIPWASNDDCWLGAPFIVMEQLPGRNFLVWDPHPALEFVPDAAALWLEAARLLGAMHRIANAELLASWEPATSLTAEIDRWERLIRHTASTADRALAARAAARLRDTMPASGAIGLVHGDFQPGNILYDGGRITGLIDWDLAAVGPQGQDIGWLMMMADSPAWADNWQPAGPPPLPDLLAAYMESGGTAVTDTDWQRAFACFRMAVITGFNLKLHREGRRVDDVWERFAPSTAPLLARAMALLQTDEANE